MSVSSAAVPDDTDAIPPKCPEANAAAVSDDTEVVSPKCTEANAAAVPDNTEVVPPKTRRAKAIAKKTQCLCARSQYPQSHRPHRTALRVLLRIP